MDKIEYFKFVNDTLKHQYPGFEFMLEEYSNFILVRCMSKNTGRVEDYAVDKSKSVYTLLSVAKQLVNKLDDGFGNYPSGIENVIFSEPATIVFFNDGTKEVVKCSDDDEYNPAAGIAFCVMKRYFGKNYHHELRKWMKKYDAEQDDWRDCSKRIADALVNLFKASEMEENTDDGSE